MHSYVQFRWPGGGTDCICTPTPCIWRYRYIIVDFVWSVIVFTNFRSFGTSLSIRVFLRMRKNLVHAFWLIIFVYCFRYSSKLGHSQFSFNECPPWFGSVKLVSFLCVNLISYLISTNAQVDDSSACTERYLTHQSGSTLSLIDVTLVSHTDQKQSGV